MDNLRPLEPDLIILGSLSHGRMNHFINNIKMMNSNLPMLILASDPSSKSSASYKGFKDVEVLKRNFEPADIRFAINKLLCDRVSKSEINKPGNPLIIGNSPELLMIKKMITDFSHLNEPVFIQGEPGTGKELVARAVHYQSQQRSSPFIKVNLAEINSDQLDEFVFGLRQKGSPNPTSSISDRYFQSDRVTLFLDEITALTPLLQSRLLTIFEDNSFRPRILKQAGLDAADVFLIISSSSSLDELVRRGKFRKDLYYRIRVMCIEIPPLRTRVGDIVPLTDFFTDQFCMEFGMEQNLLSQEIKDCFCRYPWPGNVRELRRVVRRAVLYGDVDGVMQNLWMQWEQNQGPLIYDQKIDLLAGIANFKNYLRRQKNLSLKSICGGYVMGAEKAIIRKALERTNWNRKKAAVLLGISYKSILNKIKKYRLTTSGREHMAERDVHISPQMIETNS